MDETGEQEVVTAVAGIQDSTGFSRWWLAAAALFFVALFAWSELRVRAAREQIIETEAGAAFLSGENTRLADANRTLQEELAVVGSPPSATIELAGSAGSVASGRAFLQSGTGRLYAFFTALPAVRNDGVYQLWILPRGEGGAVNAGALQPDSRGNASVVAERLPPSGVAGLRVTLEKGNTPAPAGPEVLTGRAK